MLQSSSSSSNDMMKDCWECTACTYMNHDALHLACVVCGSAKPTNKATSAERNPLKSKTSKRRRRPKKMALPEITQEEESHILSNRNEAIPRENSQLALLDRLVAAGKISPAPAQAWKKQQPMFEAWKKQQQYVEKNIINRTSRTSMKSIPTKPLNVDKFSSNDSERLNLLDRLVASGKIEKTTAQAWKKKQPKVSNWNTAEDKVRKLQIEEMRLFQEEIMQKIYASRQA